jgi:hypothetical protein
VFRLAQPSAHSPEPVTLGNVRVGAVVQQALTISNLAPNDGFSEKLNASIGGATAGVTATGAFTLLAPGAPGNAAATNTTSLVVGLDTTSAGAKVGTAAITLVSDGTGTSGLGTTSLGTQTVNVSGNVFRLAGGAATPAPIAFANARVGDTVNQALTIQNTAAADGFSEKLNAAFSGSTGAVTTSGAGVSLLNPGATNNTGLSVGLNTTTAGAKIGTVTVAYQSDGTGTTGGAPVGVRTQTIDVNGNVFRLAAAGTIGAVNFGAVHVGDTVNQALTIQNTAAADGFSEKLNASFGATSDARITTSGAVNLLAAGASNTTSMVVGLNTAAAGTVNGTARVNFQSDGTGTSGFAATGIGSQDVGVSGDIQTTAAVFRLAQPSAHSPEPVTLGNVRVGAVAQQALTISNLAPNDGFSEKLNASIGGATAGVTATGAFTLLAPGAPGNAAATNTTSLVVGLDTTSAGAKVGTAAITLVSDGTGTSGLGTTSLGTQTVNVSGNVFRLANPTLNTSAVTLAARVGDASPTAAVSVTNTSPDAFTEGLKATISAASPVFTTGGSIANLVAGTTSASALSVSLQTGTGGAFGGTATVAFTSTGAGTTGAPDVSVGSGPVTLTGKVYTPAQGQVPTPSVDFGIVHKGDAVALKPVEVRNTAAVTALNDLLLGSFTGVSAPFTGTGTLGTGLAPGAADPTSLKVGLGTVNAGLFNGSATLALASHNADLTDLTLTPVALMLAGQVNNFAKLDLTKQGGAGDLSKSGATFLLDFGTLLPGSGVRTAFLGLSNAIPSGEPGDLLDVFFGFNGADLVRILNAQDFLLTGFGPHTDILPGAEVTGPSIAFDPELGLGGFDGIITLNGHGHNASGFSEDLPPLTLELRAFVQPPGSAVPEPATLVLVLTGIVLFGAMHMLRGIRARCR